MVLGSHHFPKLWRNVSADFAVPTDPQISQGLELSFHIAIHSKAHSLQHFMDCNKDSVILWYWSENLYIVLMINEYGLDAVHYVN